MVESKTTAFTVAIARYISFANANPTALENVLRAITATKYVEIFRKNNASIYYLLPMYAMAAITATLAR